MGEADDWGMDGRVGVAVVMVAVETSAEELQEISVVVGDGSVTLMENVVLILEVHRACCQRVAQTMVNAVVVYYSVVNVVWGDHLCCCLATVEVQVEALELEAS